MRKANRALSVEAVEDRSLPSTTFVFVEPASSYRSYQPTARYAMASESAVASSRQFQTETIFRIQFSDSSVFYLRQTATGFQLLRNFAGRMPDTQAQPQAQRQATQNPVMGPMADGETRSVVGSVRNTPVPQSRGPVAPAGARFNVGEVAIAPTTQTSAVSVRADAEQAAASAAAQASVQNAQPVAGPVAQLFAGHGSAIAYAFTAVTPEADGAPGEAVPPPDSVPVPGPTTTPEAGAVESGIVQLATAVATPVAGLLPFDVSALSAGAGQFLGQVADLAPAWPDSMPAFTDTLWVATAAVLGGGAIYAARGRATPRPARDPLAGALSDWERRNGRAAG
jgi:hypothetical protein